MSITRLLWKRHGSDQTCHGEMGDSANPRHWMKCITIGLILLIAYISLVQARESKLPPQHAFGELRTPSQIVVPLHRPDVEETALHPATDTSAMLSTSTTGWFPFTIPWDDASDTVFSAADLLVDYAGQDPATVIDGRGHVRVDPDGHFYMPPLA